MVDSSPPAKKVRRYQEAVRPTYRLLRERIENSKYSKALEAASLCQLHGMFVADYPRFDGMPENVVAGYIVSHMAVRRGLGILRRQKRSIFDELPDSSDWSFEWSSPELGGNSELIQQVAQAASNWSPVLLDMDDMAQDEDGELHADKDAIPYRRSQVQVMSQRAIHDIDKPRSLSDDSVQDDYGVACLRGFFAQSSWQARVAVVHTGTLGRSLTLQQCWRECYVADTQSQLDSFLRRNSKNYTKPRGRPGSSGPGHDKIKVWLIKWKMCMINWKMVMINWKMVMINWKMVMINWKMVMISWKMVMINWKMVMINWKMCVIK